MAITVNDDDASSTERQKVTKILIINDSSSSSSSPLVNLSATTFRENIRSFLRDYAETQDYTLDDGKNTIVSRLYLVSESTGVGFPLFVIEERISSHGSSSPNPLCDFCRCVGWSHHYVSKRKYHLIITASDEWKKPLTKDSLTEVTSSSSSRQLMHGVIHCNGFGHLLCINNDVVSGFLSGDRLMDLWDRLCSTLHTRKISLDDTSRKGSMALRLLHGVAFGRPWFGKWDYTLSRGNFGVTKDQYTRAILILSSMELDTIAEDFSGTRRKEKHMKMIIAFYRESSQTPLVTLSELLQYMLAFRAKAPIVRKTARALVGMSLNPHVSTSPVPRDDDDDDEEEEDTSDTPFCSSPDQEEPEDNGNESSTDTDQDTTIMDMSPTKYDSFDAMARGECSRWSGKRLGEAAQAVLDAFKERNSVLTREELREAVRLSIGDTGMIDFLLKHIDKVLIGDQIIHKFATPGSRKFRFSLMPVNSRADLDQEAEQKEANGWTPTTPGLDPHEDILYLYHNLLLMYPDSEVYGDASEVILNCKSFVKEWPLPSYQGPNSITVSCQVVPNHEEILRDLTRKLPPGELVMVSQNTTIREL
ncbi:hypothetical protein N665_4040s0001, partial [Sinapis alba]